MNGFTWTEACDKAGRRVHLLESLPDVPVWTPGIVTGIVQAGQEYWVKVVWQLPDPSVHRADWFTKAEYERYCHED
ncbi:MAG TPA: hypothetical protein VNQ79_02455 [Blastocatellia bacterium]|nr:hypothetical protein [Blastocatellia bacterium]